MKRLLAILFLAISTGCTLAQGTAQSLVVDCGSQVDITATAKGLFVFEGWSDGVTEASRTIDVYSDTTLIAFFACPAYDELPIVPLYDWLIMVNVNELNAMGHYPDPEECLWYRVVGDPDDVNGDAEDRDDQLVARGYYLTLDKDLLHSGTYYCITRAQNPAGAYCGEGYMQSKLLDYSYSHIDDTPTKERHLYPGVATHGGPLRIEGLDKRERHTVEVFYASGQYVRTLVADGVETFYFTAESCSGCYIVRVSSPTATTIHRYIVR